MDREELLALQSALETVLNWPPAVRDEVARWLAPNDLAANAAPGPKDATETNGARSHAAANAAPKPNGHDPHPPTLISSPEGQGFRKEAAANHQRKLTVSKRPAKARQNKVNTRTAELRLTEALCDSPGMSVSALARATSANRATTRERLNGLAARGAIEKDAEGLWRLKGDAAGPTSPSPAAS